jgi:hypothetical protein
LWLSLLTDVEVERERERGRAAKSLLVVFDDTEEDQYYCAKSTLESLFFI